MPLTFAEATTPKGKRIVRTVTVGAVSRDDARALMLQVRAGGPMANLPILSIIDGAPKYESGAREELAGPSQGGAATTESKVAIVVESMIGRVVASLLLKAAGHKNNKLFRSEADAMEWIDSI